MSFRYVADDKACHKEDKSPIFLSENVWGQSNTE
jgi:hypothetical protein